MKQSLFVTSSGRKQIFTLISLLVVGGIVFGSVYAFKNFSDTNHTVKSNAAGTPVTQTNPGNSDQPLMLSDFKVPLTKSPNPPSVPPENVNPNVNCSGNILYYNLNTASRSGYGGDYVTVTLQGGFVNRYLCYLYAYAYGSEGYHQADTICISIPGVAGASCNYMGIGPKSQWIGSRQGRGCGYGLASVSSLSAATYRYCTY